MGPVLGTVSALAGVVAISYLVEALRRSPRAPDVLPWAPGVPIRHVSVHGIRMRYLEVDKALRWCCCIRCGPSSTSFNE